jgi:hypothetical protein
MGSMQIDMGFGAVAEQFEIAQSAFSGFYSYAFGNQKFLVHGVPLGCGSFYNKY